MAAGLGLTIGPFMSGIVYSYLHYAGTFLFFSFILACTGFFLFTALPHNLNRADNNSSEKAIHKNDEEELANQETEEDSEEKPSKAEKKRRRKQKQLSYKIFFKNHESIFNLSACAICMITLYHYETTLAVRLTHEMGMSEDNLGFFFCA